MQNNKTGSELKPAAAAGNAGRKTEAVCTLIPMGGGGGGGDTKIKSDLKTKREPTCPAGDRPQT